MESKNILRNGVLLNHNNKPEGVNYSVCETNKGKFVIRLCFHYSPPPLSKICVITEIFVCIHNIYALITKIKNKKL